MNDEAQCYSCIKGEESLSAIQQKELKHSLRGVGEPATFGLQVQRTRHSGTMFDLVVGVSANILTIFTHAVSEPGPVDVEVGDGAALRVPVAVAGSDRHLAAPT